MNICMCLVANGMLVCGKFVELSQQYIRETLCLSHMIIYFLQMPLFCLLMYIHHPRDQNTAYMLEAQALRSEMKHCTEQVEKLSREFNEIKKDIEAARKEVDTTRSTLTEITMKLLSTY